MPATEFALTFSEALSIFLLDRRVNNYSPKTLLHYKTLLTPFFNWSSEQGLERIDQVTLKHVRLYLFKCSESDFSETTVNTIARALRAFFNFCVTEEWLEKSPMHGMKMPKLPKKLPTVMSKEQVKKLLDSAESERDKVIMMFFLDCGLRLSELCNLNYQDIDLKVGKVLIRSGKGNKDRVVFVGAKTIKRLIKYFAVRGVPKPSEPLFLSDKTSDRVTESGVGQMLRRYERKLGFKCNPHLLRRTFATESLRAGMDILTLQKFMGHEDITVLKHYLLLLNDDLESAHRRFGLIDNL